MGVAVIHMGGHGGANSRFAGAPAIKMEVAEAGCNLLFYYLYLTRETDQYAGRLLFQCARWPLCSVFAPSNYLA